MRPGTTPGAPGRRHVRTFRRGDTLGTARRGDTLAPCGTPTTSNMITKEKHVHSVLFFRDHEKRPKAPPR
jgi:hypothetical protein